MSWSRALLSVFLTCLCLSAGVSDTYRFFVRNRAVVGKAIGEDVYVPQAELSKYFRSEELRKLEFDPTEAVVLVEGERIATEGGLVPVASLARALGLTRRVSNGIVDYSKGVQDKDLRLSEPQDTSRRSEYAEASRRLSEILRVLPECDNPDWRTRIVRIGNKVAQASPLAGLEWHFVLVQDNQPNAACVGEGHVFVTSALMEMGVSDDELAGVLGHEVAHGVRRHPFRRLDLVRDLEALIREYQRLSSQIANAEGDNGSRAVSLRNQVDSYERRRAALQSQLDNLVFYSKVDEEEADVLGLRYAVSAGYSPDGLGSCLVRLTQHAVQQFGVGVLQNDMSHPPVQRRLEILRRARDNGHF